MMTPLLHKIHSLCRKLVRLTIVIGVVILLALSPTRVFAQACEMPGSGIIAQTTIMNFDINSVMEMISNLANTFFPFYLDMMRMQLGLQDQKDWQTMFQTLNTWWSQWLPSWKGMTGQLSAATVDQTFRLGAINDATNALLAAQDEQKERIKAKLNSMPNDQACRFDTNANYLARDRAIDEALQNGFEWDFVRLGNNEKNSIAQNGPGELQNQRWNTYTQEFCDFNAEDCDSGCSNRTQNSCSATQNSPYPNMDIYVSKMLFKDETIPVGNHNGADSPVAWDAMQSMMFNVTGYKVPDPILAGAIASEPGREQMFTRREYMARMSAVGSLLYSVVGDRIEGVQATEPSDLRKMMGIGAYQYPSMRELRQSIIEQLWDPSFYKNLGDNPVTISQKELYLKAYGLTMLYDMISKQEKISTAYAIETAAILQETLDVKGNFSSEASFK